MFDLEVCGWDNSRDSEIFHRHFLWMLLKIFKFTPNCVLYGETAESYDRSPFLFTWFNFNHSMDK